jgi:hypothetical protein
LKPGAGKIEFSAKLLVSMYKFQQTAVSPSGLRFTSRENGSPFQGMGCAAETMSCIVCGNHKPRRTGSFKRYSNSLMFFCFDCKTRKLGQKDGENT